MAGPGDLDTLDPLAALMPQADVRTPWDWIPDAWRAAELAPVPVPEVAPVAPEPAPTPVPVEEPAPDLGAALVPQEAPDEPSVLGTLQPGLGVTQRAVEDAGRAQFAQGIESIGRGAGVGPAIETPAPLPEPTEEERRRAEQEELAGLSDIEFALRLRERDIAGRQQAEAAKLRAATAEREQADKAARAYEETIAAARQQRAQVEMEAAAMSADPAADWFREGGFGRTISAAIAAIAGGLVQHLNGGRNIGMEMIDQAIDRFARGRQQKLDGRRQAIAQTMQDAESDYRMRTALAMATYERAIREAEMQQAAFDPAGSRFLELEGFKRELLARQKQAAADYERQQQETLWKRYKEGSEIARDSARLALDAYQKGIRAPWVMEALGIQGGAGVVSGGAPKLTPDDFRAQGYTEVPPVPMTLKEYGQWLELRRKGKDLSGNDAQSRKQIADAEKAEAEAEAARSGFAIASPETGEPLINKNGSPFVVMDAEERKRLRSITTAAVNIRRLADRMAALRTKYGGSIKSLGSDEAQELQSLASAIDFETFKAFDLGAPSEGDKALAEGVRGGVDPTSFVKNATKGFQAYADAVEKKALAHLRGAGYTGKPLDFKSTRDLPKTQVSEEEKRIKSLFVEPGVSIDEAERQATRILKPYLKQWNTLSDEEKAAVREAERRLSGNYKSISPDQLVEIRRLGEKALAGDKSAQQTLEQVRDTAATSTLRETAKQALAGNLPIVEPAMPSAAPVDTNVDPSNLPEGLDLSRFGGQ